MEDNKNNDETLRFAVDTNHTHFIFVDNEEKGDKAMAAEIRLRSELENCLCQQRKEGANNARMDASNEDDKELDKWASAPPPLVLIAVGGGLGTLQTIKENLKHQRPVVVFVDSGGCAAHIKQYWDLGENVSEKSKEYLQGKWKVKEEYFKLVSIVCKEGRVLRGANKVPQLSFFSTSDDVSAGNDLDMRIMTSLLSDCEKTVDAINLAVRWGDPIIIQGQLEDSSEHLNSNILKEALLAYNAEAVRLLVLYNVDVKGLNIGDLYRRSIKDLLELMKIQLTQEEDQEEDGAVEEEKKSANAKVTPLPPSALSPLKRSAAQESPMFAPAENGSKWWHQLFQKRTAETAQKRTEVAIGNFFKGASDRSTFEEFARSTFALQIKKLLEKTNIIDYKKHLETRAEIAQHQQQCGADAVLELEPTWTDVMLWAVMAGRRDVAATLWPKTAEPVRAALMAAKLCMRQDKSNGLGSSDWAKDAEAYETWAVDLLECVQTGTEVEKLLSLSSTRGTSTGQKELWSCSTLDLAVRDDGAPCRAFVASRPCQQVIEGSFNGHFPDSAASIRQDASLNMVFVQLLMLPLYDICDIKVLKAQKPEPEPSDEMKKFLPGVFSQAGAEDDDSDDDDDGSCDGGSEAGEFVKALQLQRLACFWGIPKVKFVVHNLVTIVYVFNWVFSLIGWPRNDWMWHSGYMSGPEIHYSEIIGWVWTLARVGEELRQLHNQRLAYFKSYWNICDFATYAFVLIAAMVRILAFADLTSAPGYDSDLGVLVWERHIYSGDMGMSTQTRFDMLMLAQTLYALAMLLMCVRFTETLTCWKRVGLLLIIIRRMVTDVLNWLTITLLFTLGFSIFFTMLMPGNAIREDEFQRPFWASFWGLLGEMDLDTVYEYQPPHVNTGVSTLVPLGLWFYTFFATIVLVNLLIAQMSSTYEQVKEEADAFWLFERAQLILDYKDDREPSPPPFNLLFHALKLSRCLLPACLGKHVRGNSTGRGIKRQVSHDHHAWRRKDDAIAKEALSALARKRKKQEHETSEHRLKEIALGLRVLEAESRSQFEALAGRFDKLQQADVMGTADDARASKSKPAPAGHGAGTGSMDAASEVKSTDSAALVGAAPEPVVQSCIHLDVTSPALLRTAQAALNSLPPLRSLSPQPNSSGVVPQPLLQPARPARPKQIVDSASMRLSV